MGGPPCTAGAKALSAWIVKGFGIRVRWIDAWLTR
jgi:hypothetical protein